MIKHHSSAKAVMCICRIVNTMRELSVNEDKLGHKLTVHPFRFLERALSLVFRTEMVFIVYIFRFSYFFYPWEHKILPAFAIKLLADC